ncbi:MAG: hypothetical protein ACREAE_04805 [Nitrosopumilaceae archaeon]
MSAIGIPLLIFIGYVHYKRVTAYSAEADIIVESHPYYYKLPPGYNVEVLFPLYLTITKILIKLSKNEKLTNEELDEIIDLQNKINILIKGGQIGKS